MMAKRNALGKGLGALIETDSNDGQIKRDAVNEIPLDKIKANPFQPRKQFDDESLHELAESIKELGIIQPLTVSIKDDFFQLISGERRLRSARIAGLKSVPAYVRTADDQGLLEMALVENIQREDLDAIEIALSYQRLMEELEFTQEELSSRVGKKRSTIANYLRLLRLPAIIQKGLRDKEISMGHARALINIDDSDVQEMIYNQIVKHGFSVRKVEEIVRDLSENNDEKKQTKAKKRELPGKYRSMKGQLGKLLNSRIGISMNEKGKGKIVIPFKSEQDLERIVKIIENQNKDT